MIMDSGAIGQTSGKLWALTVGINRYRSFPPLQYARQDAEAVFHWLQRYQHLIPGRGMLLTEVSPDQPVLLPWAMTNTPSTLPSRDNWWSWLQSLCTTDLLQPEDVLWVFFSGYALHYQNEDYLIPWDGDPKAIVETAISVRSLLNLLHGARTSRILLVLDMSRSQGIFAPEQRPGQQTAQLVAQFGIQTLLSCQPYQFAHESADLRLGLFTSALLEGLRIHRLETLGDIALYLSDRVPQLCDLHWKPLQIPLGIGSPGFALYPQRTYPEGQPPARSPQPPSIAPILIPVTPPQGSPQPVPVAEPVSGQNPRAASSTVSSPMSPHLPSFPWHPQQDSPSITPSPDLFNGSSSSSSGGSSGHSSVRSTGTSETRLPDPSFIPRFQYPSPNPQRSFTWDPFLRWFVIAFLLLGGFLLGERLGLRQRLLSSDWLRRLETLPSGMTDQRLLYEPLPTHRPETSATSPAPETLMAQNQAILREARTIIRENPASRFSDAIATVRQIQPGEPLYDQAQADIDRWSQTIFDFALGRAQVKDYKAAIEAARLVPWDQTQYQDAQTAIDYWQQELSLQEAISRRLEEAATLLQPDSASSYSDAIGLLRTIPADHPNYEEAQDLIEDWSLTILELAEARAAQGNYQQAIEAAQLVPQFTAEQEVARSLIETWREAMGTLEAE